MVGFGCAASHFSFGQTVFRQRPLRKYGDESRCVEQSGEASHRAVQDGIWGRGGCSSFLVDVQEHLATGLWRAKRLHSNGDCR